MRPPSKILCVGVIKVFYDYSFFLVVDELNSTRVELNNTEYQLIIVTDTDNQLQAPTRFEL